MHALISTTYKKKKLYLAHVAAVNERARNACVRKAGNVRMYARERTARAPASSRTGTQRVRVWGR